MSMDTPLEKLYDIHQPDQFDLCQGGSSNRHFQWKSMEFHLNRHIVLRQLGLGLPFLTCRHLMWVLQGIPKIRSLISGFYGLKLNFPIIIKGIGKCP